MTSAPTYPIIITGPTCAGKTTLQKALCAAYPTRTRRVVSYTTRPRRLGEVDAIDYHFFSREAYQALPDRIYEHRGSTGSYCLRARDLEPVHGDPGRVPVIVLDLSAAEKCHQGDTGYVVGLYHGARALIDRKRLRDGVVTKAEAASIRRAVVAAWRMYEVRGHVDASFFNIDPGADDIAEIWERYIFWLTRIVRREHGGEVGR